MSKANKGPGRPAGSATHGKELRIQVCQQFRCSEGYNQVVDLLVASGRYTSKADVYHDAMLQLARSQKTLTGKEGKAFDYWRNKIV